MRITTSNCLASASVNCTPVRMREGKMAQHNSSRGSVACCKTKVQALKHSFFCHTIADVDCQRNIVFNPDQTSHTSAWLRYAPAHSSLSLSLPVTIHWTDALHENARLEFSVTLKIDDWNSIRVLSKVQVIWSNVQYKHAESNGRWTGDPGTLARACWKLLRQLTDMTVGAPQNVGSEGHMSWVP